MKEAALPVARAFTAARGRGGVDPTTWMVHACMHMPPSQPRRARPPVPHTPSKYVVQCMPS